LLQSPSMQSDSVLFRNCRHRDSVQPLPAFIQAQSLYRTSALYLMSSRGCPLRIFSVLTRDRSSSRPMLFQASIAPLEFQHPCLF
jgi:hypothetical protein